MIFDPQLLPYICAAVIACVFLLMFVALIRTRRKLQATLQKIQHDLDNKLDSFEEEHLNTEIQQRDEIQRSLYQMNESLVNTFSSMSRAQSEQVNAIIRQSYDHEQGMQRIVDENMRRMDERVKSLEENVARGLAQNETRLENMRKTVDENIRSMRDENTTKLTEIRSVVDEKLNETLEKRLSSSFSQVSERLEQVYKSLGEVHSLASGVGDLKRMLGNVKTRGVWGEIQLGALLEQALTEAQYDTNVAVMPGSNERVEFAVRLPGKDHDGTPVYLPIDSKFPQEAYARLAEAAENGESAAVEEAQKALLSAVRTEARRIGKYIAPPHTTDFAIMFLPLEGLYAEVVRHSGIVEAIQREQRILISGPSTLLDLLNSLQMGFRTLAIEQRSAEVWKLLGAVKGDFGSFAALLQKTQEKLQQATDSIDSAFSKTRSIEKRLRHVEALDQQQAQQLLQADNEI